MASSYSHRRPSRRLPSLWRHLVLALTLLASVAVGAFAAVKVAGDPGDAYDPGETIIVEEVIPAPTEPVLPDNSALPDLLEDDVAEGVNPTESLTEDLAGGADKPKSKTITLNGKALGSSRRDALKAAPISGLSRMTSFGPVPAPSGSQTPLSAYKRPFTLPAGKRAVSVVIGGLGFDADVTRRAIEDLPADVTLAFAAAAPNLQNWIDDARARGHEVLLEVPMESYAFNPAEPGASLALRADAKATENINALDRIMSRRHGYFGITNYNGDKFLISESALFPVMAHLKSAGLGFIFDGSVEGTNPARQAQLSTLPYTAARTLLDVDSQTPDYILQQLNSLASSAGPRSAIGMGFAYPDTIEAVRNWALTLEGRGLVLAPASYALPQ